MKELRPKYELPIILEISGLPRSTYYYCLHKVDKDEKNVSLINRIKELFALNKGMYGYRRITAQLKNEGYKVNHKKVQRLMRKEGLICAQRKKRKYSSYKGTVGKIADNLIQRDFTADRANEKWFTDVTEFRLKDQKCYLSPIMDAYGQEIISWTISLSPNLEQVHNMLEKHTWRTLIQRERFFTLTKAGSTSMKATLKVWNLMVYGKVCPEKATAWIMA